MRRLGDALQGQRKWENKQQVQNVSLEKHLKLKKKHMPPIPISL